MDKKQTIQKLEDLLIAAQNKDPCRLDPSRDEILQVLWKKVTTYPFAALQPRCIPLLEAALKSDLALAQLARGAFPF
jgi:hypothetical protein